MAIDHDGVVAPVLDRSWVIGDVDTLAFVWDGVLYESEQIISSQWITGDDWVVRAQFDGRSLSYHGQEFTSVYAVLLECLLTDDDLAAQYSSTKTLGAVTQRVVLSGGRELSRTVFIPVVKN